MSLPARLRIRAIPLTVLACSISACGPNAVRDKPPTGYHCVVDAKPVSFTHKESAGTISWTMLFAPDSVRAMEAQVAYDPSGRVIPMQQRELSCAIQKTLNNEGVCHDFTYAPNGRQLLDDGSLRVAGVCADAI